MPGLHLPVPLAERLATDPALPCSASPAARRSGGTSRRSPARKRVVLELGGNAAAVVHGDAQDLGALAARIAWGAFAYAGQVCIKVQRLLIHRPIYRRFLADGGGGDPAAGGRRPRAIPPPSSARSSMMARRTGCRRGFARRIKEGGRALVRGRRRGAARHADHPGVVSGDSKVSCREVFGPVLTVAPYAGGTTPSGGSTTPNSACRQGYSPRTRPRLRRLPPPGRGRRGRQRHSHPPARPPPLWRREVVGVRKRGTPRGDARDDGAAVAALETRRGPVTPSPQGTVANCASSSSFSRRCPGVSSENVQRTMPSRSIRT